MDPPVYDVVNYLDGTRLEGQFATDRVCPIEEDPTSCSTFKFSALYTVQDIKDYMDGILGLWSGNTADEDYDLTEMLIPTMKEQGVITTEMFSFYLTGLEGESYIDFG